MNKIKTDNDKRWCCLALVIAFFMLFIVLCPTRALAETIDGIITEVYDGGQSIVIERMNAFNEVEDVTLKIRPDVDLEGISSLTQLEPGRRVEVEVENEFTEPYWVRKLEVAGPIPNVIRYDEV